MPDDPEPRNDPEYDVTPSTMGVILRRIVLEIDDAAETLKDIQASLSPVLLQAADHSILAKAQGLDLLEQIMRDLSVVVAKMADSPAAAERLDAAAIVGKCKLENVAKRLQGLSADPSHDHVDFF